jgi:hypothetical protein
LVWSRNGEEIAQIGYRTEDARFVLDYRVRLYGGDWESIEQPTRITYTPCNYGNSRFCSRVIKLDNFHQSLRVLSPA